MRSTSFVGGLIGATIVPRTLARIPMNKPNLRRTAFKSTAWFFFGNIGQQTISVLVFVYLARVVSPKDFGAMALATALVDFLSNFGRLGQVEALLRRPMTETRLSTSFWMQIMISVGLGAVIAASSPLFANIYAVDALQSILLAMAPFPFLLIVGQVHESEARRHYLHKYLALRAMLATFASGLVSFGLAFYGAGYWALVAQRLVFAATYSSVLIVSYRWRPRFIFDRSEARELFKTGFDVSIASLLFIVNVRIFDLVVGYFVGTTQLGFVKIAFRLGDLLREVILQPVVQVSNSVFSTYAENASQLRAAALRYLMLLTLVGFPIYAVLALLARDVVLLLVGEKWLPSADILAILCLSAPTMAMSLLFGPIMVNAGKSRRVRSTAVIQMLLTFAFVSAAAPFGLVSALGAVIAVSYAAFLLQLLYLKHDLNIDLAPFSRSSGVALLASLVMAAGLWLSENAFDGMAQLPKLIAEALVCAALFVLSMSLLSLLPMFRGAVADNVQFVRSVLARRVTTRPNPSPEADG